MRDQPRRDETRSSSADKKARPNIRQYDFTHPERLSRHQLRALESVHREAARDMSSGLSTRGIGHAEVQLRGITQTRVRDLVAELPEPSIVELLAVKPLNAPGLMQIDVDVGSAMINLLLGGRRHSEATRRSLTELEQVVLHDVVDMLRASLEAAWRKLCAVELAVAGSTDAVFASHLGQEQDPVLVAHFQVAVTGAEGGLTFALPILALERAHLLEAQRPGTSVDPSELAPAALEEASRRRAALLATVPVRCAAQLARFPLALAEVSRLGVGDLLFLGLASDARAELAVGNRCRFPGHLYVSGSKLYIRLLSDQQTDRR